MTIEKPKQRPEKMHRNAFDPVPSVPTSGASQDLHNEAASQSKSSFPFNRPKTTSFLGGNRFQRQAWPHCFPTAIVPHGRSVGTTSGPSPNAQHSPVFSLAYRTGDEENRAADVPKHVDSSHDGDRETNEVHGKEVESFSGLHEEPKTKLQRERADSDVEWVIRASDSTSSKP